MTGVWDRVAAEFRDDGPRWASPAAMAQDLDPDFVLTPALQLIDDALVDVAAGRCRRLLVSCPPQEGKSTLIGHWYPLWLLQHKPDTAVVIASFEQQLAERAGRSIRDAITTHNGKGDSNDLGLRVKRGDHAAGRWSLEGRKGGVYSAGVGAALTGRRADALVIDDPTKSFEEAQSSAHRARLWHWWQTVARTRLGPSASVVVVATRWHAQDLPGKLLEEASEPWRLINIPAIADSPDDLLGREVGEPLISARGRTLADWEATRAAVGEYAWASLYQGRPAPASGGIFKRDRVKFWRPITMAGYEAFDLDGRQVMLRDCWRFAVADLAASVKTSADYTVIAAFALWLDGHDLILLDLARERIQPSGHLDLARPLVQRWGCETLYIESTFHSATLTYEATRAGIPVSELKADADKVTRALPAAARVDQGRVWTPSGAPWTADFLDEIASFPNGAHDDMTDCLGYAARIAATHFTPQLTAEQEQAQRPVYDPFEAQLDAALGTDGSLDLWGVSW